MTEQLPAGCELRRQVARGDHRGSLIAIEALSDIPFDIARVYYMFGTTPGEARGFHAHRRLRQFAVCVAGACDMLLDDGSIRTTVRLDDPATGLLIGPSIWREMHDFAPGTVLMVLADQVYDEDDYIRDYDDFRATLTGPTVTGAAA